MFERYKLSPLVCSAEFSSCRLVVQTTLSFPSRRREDIGADQATESSRGELLLWSKEADTRNERLVFLSFLDKLVLKLVSEVPVHIISVLKAVKMFQTVAP